MPDQGGLMQILSQLQGGGMPQQGMPPQGMPPGMMGGGPPEAAEGEGGSNPLIMLLLSLLAGQGQMPTGGQQGPSPAMAMPPSGGSGY